MAKAAASDGTYPYSAGREVRGRQRSADVLPPGALILARHDSSDFSATWARCGDGSVIIEEFPSHTYVVALATSAVGASELIEQVVSYCSDPVINDDVQACLWLQGQSGLVRHYRKFQTPPWEGIARNYPAGTARQIADLRKAGTPTGTGRLLLWHGPPGTGKTRAVLALLHAWRHWCAADIVTDPERMFGDAGYLVEVLAQSPRNRPWRLIVCEDADEYLRSDARQRSGPGLGRLLNATDGLLGRASQSLILLTTNDELGRLHPAVTRPGRCLSLVKFELFSSTAAGAWLGLPVTRAMSLAELYELQTGGQRVSVEPLPTGAYL